MSDVLPEYDYPYLPGEELNPLVENTLHFRWLATLQMAISHTLADAGSDSLVAGNSPFEAEKNRFSAPDIMIVPGMKGRNFGVYRPGVDGPAPTACLEVMSPSNTPAILDRRFRRWLNAGAEEVYLLDPERNTIERVWLDGDELRFTDARGEHSPAMNITFAVIDGKLALCCPAGRTVGVDTDSFAWLAEEQRRADQAELRADIADERAARAEAALAELRRRLGEDE